MQTIENDSAVVPFPATPADETPQNNYEPVRYNAMKHGILSKLAVLAHEDAGEFGDLLAARRNLYPYRVPVERDHFKLQVEMAKAGRYWNSQTTHRLKKDNQK
ncbi:MAG TPA: hypothetical protein VMV48_09075 [Gallionellaceae bacterium]|nr:hypothetical protein [Gallionellaceae bacterium]